MIDCDRCEQNVRWDCQRLLHSRRAGDCAVLMVGKLGWCIALWKHHMDIREFEEI